MDLSTKHGASLKSSAPILLLTIFAALALPACSANIMHVSSDLKSSEIDAALHRFGHTSDASVSEGIEVALQSVFQRGGLSLFRSSLAEANPACPAPTSTILTCSFERTEVVRSSGIAPRFVRTAWKISVSYKLSRGIIYISARTTSTAKEVEG